MEKKKSLFRMEITTYCFTIKKNMYMYFIQEMLNVENK